MNQGKIIEYIEQGKIICSLCLQDKGNKLHLLTPLNRQVNLPPKRALNISSSFINFENPREELISRLKQAEKHREQLKSEIQVREIWELIKDENELFDYQYLAQLCFGEEITDDHVSALIRALFEDRLYFKMKDGAFLPNTDDRVEKIIAQRDEEAKKEESLQEGSSWLSKRLQGEEDESSPPPDGLIDALIGLGIKGKEASDYKFGKELLSRIGVTDISKARDILIRLGVWEDDEPVDLLRMEIRNTFSEIQVKESERLGSAGMGMSGLEDLRDLQCFTIDGPLTKDFDDALSVEIEDGYILLGIHIADVSSIIPPDSILDEEAFQRASSLYLPRRQIPMFPFSLSEDTLSLKKNTDRRAISLMARFDNSGNLYDYRFVLSLINIKNQYTYEQINSEYMEQERFVQMYRLCEQLRQKRVEQGALILSLPEISVKIGDDSSLSLEMFSQDTPSRMIVAEFMVLYNWLASRFCRDNNIPFLYRAQKGPSEMLSMGDSGYVDYVFRQRRKLCPLVIDTKPAPHAGLGLDVYSNLSSPIRRYFDLVCQRQIKSYLLNEPPVYNLEGLDRIRISISTVLKDLNIIRRNRTRYWILKYLSMNSGNSYPGTILDIMRGKYRIILSDYLFAAEMKRESNHDFLTGESIMVRVKKSDPWNDVLILEYAGKLEPEQMAQGT